jgi:Bax protein
MSISLLTAAGLPKNYYNIKNIKEQKKAFFNILSPMIEKEQKKVLRDREFVKSYFHSGLFGFRHDGLGVLKLMKIKKYYKIKDLYSYEEYLRKVDIIPTSIILAQAALESGWGKSRFVRKANNIFGQWTYSGKGLIPENRDEGAKHRIKIFKSLQDAIQAYLRNINTGWAYKSLRKKREMLRKNNVAINGLDLYDQYINYSQIREEYIKRLKKMILQNNLLIYDKVD